MSKFELRYSNRFLKDVAKLLRQGKDTQKLDKVVELLREGQALPPEYKDHQLIGDFEGYRECHIEFDWLLLYKKDKKILTLFLSRTGSHVEILGK